MSFIEELEPLRKKIDQIDIEIIDKLKKWVQAHKNTPDFNIELELRSFQETAHEHGFQVEDLLPIFQAMIDLTEKERERT